MSEFLLQYEKVAPTTWAYLSSLLMIGLFFKFSRFWSVRNLDIILLILLAPGLLLYIYGREEANRGEALIAEEGQRAVVAEADASIPLPSDLPTGVPRAATEVEPEPDARIGVASPGVEPESAEEDLEREPEFAAAEAPLALGNLAPAGQAQVESEEEESEGQRQYAAGRSTMRLGFHWLFSVGALLLVRLLLDPTMVRRPLLEPNLSTGGLAFIGCSLFIFLMANVISSVPTEDDLRGPKSAEQLLSGESEQLEVNTLRRHGPGYALLNLIPSIPTMPLLRREQETVEAKQLAYATAAKSMAILAHLATVIGIVGVGYWHFDNIKMGMGAATMYLMLPYTAQMTGRIDHVIPAALLVWAVLCYRRPLTTGMFLGLAIGVVYYPLFLLPLWCSFYWQRGLMRFVIGVVSMLAVMVLMLIFVPDDASFFDKFRQMFGLWTPAMNNLDGIWSLGWYAVYRIPILVAFVALSGILALWPAQKNLGTLLSCSGGVMLATQFWHGYGGGLYMAWYLPLLLLTIFRPNLEDRVALTVLGVGWFPRRRLNFASVDKAA